MSKPKAPAPPDPVKTAQAQTQQSIDTAIANNAMGMVNQRTPDGSLTYNIVDYYTDPGTGKRIPRYEAITELSSDAQALRDASNRGNLTLANLGADQAARAGDLLSRPMDTSTLPPRADRSGQAPVQYGADLTTPEYGSSAGLRTGYETDFSADRRRVEDALFARLDPQLARSREDTERNLSNRGIKLGSDEYDRQQRNLGQTENDARLATILAAGDEQSRLAGLTRDEATFGNSAKQMELENQIRAAGQGFADRMAVQGRSDANANNQFSQRQALLDALDRSRAGNLQEQFAIRNQPLNEITALLSGAQIATPNFGIAQPSAMPTTDVAGLTQQGFQNQLQNYQIKNSNYQDIVGGLFGLGRAGVMASDRRFKKDVVKVGKLSGHNIYAYRYQNEDDDAPKHVGVMAQEVEKERPDAVIDTPIGKAVDYPKLFGIGNIPEAA